MYRDPMSDDPKAVPYEQLHDERVALRNAAIHLAAMILADATGSLGGGSLSQNGALLDLETRAIRYVRRLDELAGSSAPSDPESLVH